ncbi:MAG TPA: response regulator transcription factor [Cellvibrionaceae bacterium]
MKISIVKVLVVEDELTARHLLRGYLEEQGWHVDESAGSEDVVGRVLSDNYDLVFLDIRLPGLDGISLCREIRARHVAGIIITSGICDPVERIVGLEAGADAYYAKPLPMRELIAGSKALLRRVQEIKRLHSGQTQSLPPTWYFDSWQYDTQRQLVVGSEGRVGLSYSEGLVLQALCASPGVVVKRDTLMKAMGRSDWLPFDRTLDVLVGRLRNKLRQAVPEPNLITAQYGRGYVLNTRLQSSSSWT